MSSSPANNHASKAPLKDRIIPWYFVMLFAVVFAVNAVFVYLALHTKPGVVNQHHFEAGVAYNRVIEQSQEQRERGWQSHLHIGDSMLRVSLHNKHSQPLEDARVTATLTHPVRAFTAQQFTLTPTENGHYETHFSFPSQGQWNIQIDALCNQLPFHQTHRVIAP